MVKHVVADPRPGVFDHHRNRVRFPVRAQANRPVLGRKLERIADQVVEHALESGIVGAGEEGTRPDIHLQLNAAVGRTGAIDLHGLLQSTHHVDRFHVELPAVGLQLREVEYGRDRVEQAAPARPDQTGKVVVRLRDFLLQNFCKPNDGGERRADLVAHVGQENRL